MKAIKMDRDWMKDLLNNDVNITGGLGVLNVNRTV